MGDKVQDLEAAMEILRSRVRPDRVEDVLQRPIPREGGRCLSDLIEAGENARVLEVVRRMFDLRRTQP